MQISWIHNARFNSWRSISANRRCPTGLWNSSLIVGEPGVLLYKVARFKGKNLAGNVIHEPRGQQFHIYEITQLNGEGGSLSNVSAPFLLSRRNSLSSSRDKLIYNKLLFDREHSGDVKNVLSSAASHGNASSRLCPLLHETIRSTDRSFFFDQLTATDGIEVTFDI